MSDLRRLNGNNGRWFLLRWILALALFGSSLNVFAESNVVAWGAGMIYNPADTNDYGQSIVPTDLTNAAMVAGGWWHSLALKADGTLEGWGDDSQGQTTFSPAGASNYVAIACGWWHSLALKSDGTVAAAGYSLGDLYGQTDVPGNLSNVVAIACGFFHSLALKADGTVVAWGGTVPRITVRRTFPPV